MPAAFLLEGGGFMLLEGGGLMLLEGSTDDPPPTPPSGGNPQVIIGDRSGDMETSSTVTVLGEG